MGCSYALLAAFFAFSGQTLDAIDGKRIDKSELSKSVIDGLLASKNPSLRSKAEALLKK
jgi:hypothetical protein